MHKTRQVLTKPNKTSDVKNKLHVSTYIKTITGETNQQPSEKHTVKTYCTNMTLDVKPQHRYHYIFAESITRWQAYIQTNS